MIHACTMTSMSSQYRIITVCTGNICRSPMAELMLAEAIAAEGLAGAVVDSAGITAYEVGRPIDPRAARKQGQHPPANGGVRQIMRENSRTLPLLFTAPPPALKCDDLKRLRDTPVVVARGNATRTFYTIAVESAAACIPASTLVVVPNARHLLPVEDDTRFTTLITDLLT